MTRYKIQTLKSLRDEMRAVARGERPAPADAAKPSFNSVKAAKFIAEEHMALSVRRPKIFSCLALLFLVLSSSRARSATSPLYTDPSQPVDARVEDLLGRMTPQEKASLTAGQDYFSTCAIPRLGIPSLKMTDGPNGVRWGRTTAFPTGICLAASWDTDLAGQYGRALGQEALGQDRSMLLGPCVNINRYPLGGRSFESLGEDPWLTSRLAVAYIEGVQSQGVASCIKHFAANNEEDDRMTVDAEVDERVLREIYLPAFEAAVREAKVDAVMAAYNRLNGPYCSANPWLESQVLKKEWGFQGLVVSDWGATHEGDGALLAGLDLEMPGPGSYLGLKLLPDLEFGRLPQTAVDEAARRILRVLFTLGPFDHPSQQHSSALHRDLARQVAEEGMVLLKNRGGLLPLRASLRSLAVIGPNADVARTGGGGSSEVDPVDPVSPLDGLKKRLGSGVKIVFAKGTRGDELVPVPASRLRGLKAEYFSNKDLQGAPVIRRREKNVDHIWRGDSSPGPGIAHTYFSACWRGRLVPEHSGETLLGVNGDDGYRLFVNGKLLVSNWSDHAAQIRTAALHLVAGRSYALKLEYYQALGDASVTLGWGEPQDKLLQQAVDAARRSDAAIVFVGLSDRFETEGSDRASFGLPAGQDALVQAVVKANPHTVVVLNAGSPVDMEAWVHAVPALLLAWYPGIEGGDAIARILKGDTDPSGKLPVSFPHKLSDSPAFGHFPGGTDGVARYAEGLLVGYRYYDTKGVAPLFPFGYGLSYTQFKYSGLEFQNQGKGVEVSFSLKNIGPMEGAEVAQVYIRPMHPRVDRPFQELKGFQRVLLKKGAEQRVEISLNSRSFSYWDEGAKQWSEDPGGYEIRVGSSSRDIRLRKIWTLEP